MEVVGLWRYPVKSLQGEELAVAGIEPDGLVGDRRWGIRDGGTDRILTARRRPELLAASASYDDDLPVITLPDGRVAVGPGESTDRLLSEWLGGPVSLVPSRGTDPGRAEFFADATDDTSQAIEWTMPEGRYVDAAPLLVLTTVSLRTGAHLHPDGVWDPRRFRPNILIDLEGDGWIEDGWVGRLLQVGDATVRPIEPCTRCTMVTRAQPGLETDRDVFRTLARHHQGHLGVWADVATPGTVSTGRPASVIRMEQPVAPSG
ncbi:MOSC N-terminal beta barrel domain-containing protein [Nocardioides sp. W7]|uniref:MOSC domain-containing protein n=1 Tax=Nocardioides sp. W7 TaxID=2931390 RepID=UPI001FD4F841|nr:MOSC N-terminal beta barrel domain-containing protein [Nocardioides sp. W7]